MSFEKTNLEFIILIAIAVVVFLLTILIVVLVISQRVLREKQKQIYQSIIATQIAEQKRIGTELHDVICVKVGGIISSLELISSTNDYVNILPQINPLRAISDEIRLISHNLEQTSFIKSGLSAAISDYCDRLEGLTIQIKVNQQHSFEKLPVVIQHQLLNMVRELVYNAKKHSKSDLIKVSLTQHNNQGNIIVQDNGVGFSLNNIQEGLGLRSVKNRVNLLGGQLQIGNAPTGKGALVRITFPIK
jgi:signal transduction histidine kinase